MSNDEKGAEQRHTGGDSAGSERLRTFYRHLHQYPELAMEEYETTAAIRDWLGEEGIRVADQFELPTGLVAEVGSGGGPIVALRADIDALPVQEASTHHYPSKIPGKMHACGHDFHTAALIGAGILLKHKEAELQGTVRLLFQPSEENAKGARLVINSGALEQVEAVFGLHNKPDLPTGVIGIKEGAIMAAADGFVIEVEGRGTHAAVPEAGLDPIVVAAHIITALQSVISRNVGAQESAVVSVTRLHSGVTWNVISDKAVLDGTVRTFDEGVRQRVRTRVDQIVAGVAAAFDTTASVRWIEGPPAVTNAAAWVKAAEQAAQIAGLEVITAVPSPAGEDFALYQRETPGLFAFLGTSGPHEWHHPSFEVDEEALPLAARYLAAVAERALDELNHRSDSRKA